MVTPEDPTPDGAAPPPKPRPALAKWLWDRDLDFRDGGRMFGCSHAALQNYCRPFDDDERRVPKPKLMEAIVVKTGGAVKPASFYPDWLNVFGDPAEPEATQ